MSEDDYARIAEAAAREGLSVSAYVASRAATAAFRENPNTVTVGNISVQISSTEAVGEAQRAVARAMTLGARYA
nr:hypothetical protein [Pseudonocardia sediminis]